MADTYVLKDGQLCRKFDSYEAVDLGQLELKVQADEETLAQRERELSDLQVKLQEKEDEVSEAERTLDNSKSGVQAARALVDGESLSDEEAAGDGGEAYNPEAQSVHVNVYSG